MERDCNTTFDTNISDFYVNHLTEKYFQKITSLDLLDAYKKSQQISCLSFKQEVQKTCIQKLFLLRNKTPRAKELLDSYVNDTGDSAFYDFMENKFGFSKPDIDFSNNVNDLLFDVDDKEHLFTDILKTNKGKVVLVDFWASWCAPCRMSIPDVKKLEEKYASNDFEVIYVSIDKHPNPWKRAAKDDAIYNGNNYWSSNWNNSKMFNEFKITRIPRYILYDKSGEVAYSNAPKPDAIADIIDELLK